MPCKIPLIRILPALSAATLILGTILAACKRTGITLPPAQATFLNQTSGIYYITGADVTDTIPIGVTTAATVDRIVTFMVSSPSGAVPGTQYTLAADSITIPAGMATGYIVVRGNFAHYSGSPLKDTLVFTFTDNKSGGIAPSDFNDTFTLVMSGPCIEGQGFDPAEFNGTYNNCIDVQTGYTSSGYAVSISSTSTGPTSATLLIQNLGYGEFQPFANTDPVINPGITVDLDWSSPPTLTATVLSQPYFLYAGYLPVTIVTDTGSFSSCHQSFALNYDVNVGGYDFGVVTTTIAR